MYGIQYQRSVYNASSVNMIKNRIYMYLVKAGHTTQGKVTLKIV